MLANGSLHVRLRENVLRTLEVPRRHRRVGNADAYDFSFVSGLTVLHRPNQTSRREMLQARTIETFARRPMTRRVAVIV